MVKHDESFKDLIDPLINEIINKKRVFESEYDDSPVMKEVRWQTALEGHFFDQLYKLSDHVTAEQIGEYVIEFFNSWDDEKF